MINCNLNADRKVNSKTWLKHGKLQSHSSIQLDCSLPKKEGTVYILSIFFKSKFIDYNLKKQTKSCKKISCIIVIKVLLKGQKRK